MRWDDPTLRERLASEYVAGLLRGQARARFARRLQEDPALQRHVAHWQARFAELLTIAPPVQPPSRVWQHIAQRARAHADPDQTNTLVRRLSWWRWSAVSGFATALILALVLILQSTHLLEPRRPGSPSAPLAAPVAVLQNAQQQAVFLARMETRHARIVLSALHTLAVPPGHSLQLWIIKKQKGAAPVSVAVLQQDAGKGLVLPLPASVKYAQIAALAISLEPAGGSPKPYPTGPVLYQGALQAGI